VTNGSISWRLALFYAALFGTVGLQLPYWQVWLSDKGLTPALLGLVSGLSLFARAVSGPVIGYAADRAANRRGAAILLAACGLLSALCFLAADGITAIIVINIVVTMFVAALSPMIEAMGVRASFSRNLNYGGLRLWGSLAFMVAVFLGGSLLEEFGSSAIYWSFVAGISIALGVAFLLPADRFIVPDGHEGVSVPFSRRAVMQLVRAPLFLLFLAGAATIQASHALYYTLGTVHWKAAGITGPSLSVLWTVGVAAEIVLLYFFGGHRRDRLGATGWLMIGAAAAVLRWTLTALDPSYAVLVPVQILHGLTFGAAHLGAMMFLSQAVPHAFAATAQNMYGSAFAVILGLASMISGNLYESWGGATYGLMAAMAAAGAVFVALLSRLWSGGTVMTSESPAPAAAAAIPAD
jgi:MFS transporter, PPP family, 3-phenylpropionic acid transporter